MKLILLSGGSGKRLWPLSNDTRSKQFLKMLSDDKGQPESMVQRVWRQLNEVGLSKDTFIATSSAHVDMITNQLGEDISLIIEPERRDTFPAISLATTYLHSNKLIDADEVVVVLPVDPYVASDFFLQVKRFRDILAESNASLGLIGIKPTYPSAKYGYIIPTQSDIDHYQWVGQFCEKPTEEVAATLIDQGALWNGGIFAFKLGFMLGILEEKSYPTDYPTFLSSYSAMPKISFDYEVVEKINQIVVQQYDGYWKDLGTWNTLTEEMASNSVGKAKLSEDCSNTHVLNELDIPIIALGVSDVVISASPDGILVTDKEKSPKLKELLKAVDFNRPMYEERRWGWYKVLDFIKQDCGDEVLTKRICLLKGKNLSYQYHRFRKEIWTVISGEGEFILNGVKKYVATGDVLHIDFNDKHAIRAIQDLEIIEVQMGSKLVEEDIIRLAFTWEDIENKILIET